MSPPAAVEHRAYLRIGVLERQLAAVEAADLAVARVRVEVTAVPLVDGGRVVGVLGIGHAYGRVREDGGGADLEQRLTPRQREVLRLLCAGRSTREIADELALSQETVRNHVRHVLRRLRARTRLEAVLEARRLGLPD